MKVSVIGAGVWGTALGVVAEKAGAEVFLWARDKTVLDAIQHGQRHPGLPNIALSPRIRVSPELSQAAQADVIILGVEAQAYRAVSLQLAPCLQPSTVVVVAAKGFEEGTGLLMTDILAQTLPDADVAVLSGPNFAHEVAQGLPAAAVVASSPQAWDILKEALSYSHFRLYHSLDEVGVQVSGALKNVVAIACGIVKGRNLGENAAAAIICRGLAEMRRLGVAMGAQSDTFAGLAGVGDLMLTCLGSRSRNLRFGEALVTTTESRENLLKELKTVEGIQTIQSVRILAAKHKVDLPIFEAVYRLLYEGAEVEAMMQKLLAHPLKAELESADP